jgi:perosamine synthetase
MNGKSCTTGLAEDVIAAIRAVVGPGPVGLHEPDLKGNAWLYLKECLDTGFVSSVGKFVDRFEAELAAYTGVRHAIAVVNGTAALHTSLMLAGVESNDEVLVPTLTFVATANAVRYCGATPHFVDSEENTLGMAAGSLRDYLESIAEQKNGQCVNRITGRIIRAMVPMHAFGHPSNLDGLLSIAHDFNLALIEDAAESLGSYYYGRHTGTFGSMGVLSFNGNKVLTTGGGGAILTNDSDLARRAKHLTTTSKLRHRWAFEHDEVGYNYRMPNINAALGCAQLEILPDLLAAKRRLHSRYLGAFSSIRHIKLMVEPDGCHSNYWLQTLLLDDEVATQRDAVLEGCNDAGLMARPAWNLMHSMTPFRNCPHSPLTVAESLKRRIINIPSSAFLV